MADDQESGKHLATPTGLLTGHPRLCTGVLLTLLVMQAVTPNLIASQPSARLLAPPIYRIVEDSTRAVSSELFASILGIKEFSDGSLMINDPFAQRLLLLPARGGKARLVASSVGEGFAYGSFPSVLIPYLGDSALFVDHQALGFVVLDANGQVRRVIATPRPRDLVSLPVLGQPTLDSAGVLYYRVLPSPRIDSTPQVAAHGDSATVFRVDLATRAWTALARLEAPVARRTRVTTPSGTATVRTVVNPLPVYDDFAVSAAGEVGVIRARDYRVDWVRHDGRLDRGEKLPMDWRPLSDADKEKIIDSARLASEQNLKRLQANGRIRGTPPQFEVVTPAELPQYIPAVRPGYSRVDPTGNLWVPPTTSASAEPGAWLYDVISRQGVLLYRIQLPPHRTLVAFGAARVLYLANLDSAGIRLERANMPLVTR